MFLCECGCGNETKWNAQKKEYNKRCVGHYERTKESRLNLSNAQKARFEKDPELRRKMSEFQTNRGYFAKHNKTEAHSKKVIKSNQNRIVSEETKRKTSKSLMGHKRSKKSILKQNITKIDNKSAKGKNNSAWKNGISPYKNTGEWIKLSKEIKKRDKYTCQKCGSIKFPVTHHIDFTKDNHEPLNLTTLCKSCHIRIHIKHKKEKINAV